MARKKANKHLSPRDQLLITCFLESHRERAMKGLDTSVKAMALNPVNTQFQGMGDHFTKLISVIDDMLCYLRAKQNWLPIFEAACSELEIESCPQQA